MRLSRGFSFLLLCAYVVVVGAAFLFVLNMSSTTQESVGDSEIVVVMEPRILLPGNCATVHWSFTQTRLRNLDGNEIPEQGSERFCPSIPLGRQFNIVTDDGIPYETIAYVGVFPRGRTVQLGILAALAGFGLWIVWVALVGDLPLLSPFVRHVGRQLRHRSNSLVSMLYSDRVRVLWSQFASFAGNRDMWVVAVSGGLLALPLIVARFDQRFNTPAVVFVGVGGALMFTLWWLRKSHLSTLSPKAATQRPQLSKLLISSGLLLFCAIVAYYLPMRDQFWVGGDEVWVLENATKGWDVFREYDLRFGRPLTPLGSPIAGNLTSTGVDGYLWFAVMVRYITAALIYAVIQHLLPRSGALSMAAAVLFITSPTEGSRFLAVYMQGYIVPVMFTLLALLLYLRSLARGNRVLLLLGCVVLAMGLMSVEVTYLAALFIPVLLILGYRKHSSLFAWLFAWFVTMSLCALRFMVFVLQNRDTNYQLEVATGGSPLEGLVAQLLPTLEYLRIVEASPSQWLYAGMVSSVVILIMLYMFREQPVALTRRQWLLTTICCIVGLLLAIVPYILLPLNHALSDRFRTQYFAAPFQAVLWTLLIAGIGVMFFRSSAQRWLVGAVGILVALSTVNNLTDAARRTFNPLTSYANVSHFIHQMRTLAPGFAPDTFLIYVLEDGIASPIGWNYSVFMLSQSLLGAPGVIVGTEDQLGATYLYLDLETISNNWAVAIDASQLVLFEVDANANVRLLETIPEHIIESADQRAFFQSVYAPEVRIMATSFEAEMLRFFVDR